MEKITFEQYAIDNLSKSDIRRIESYDRQTTHQIGQSLLYQATRIYLDINQNSDLVESKYETFDYNDKVWSWKKMKYINKTFNGTYKVYYYDERFLKIVVDKLIEIIYKCGTQKEFNNFIFTLNFTK